MAFAVDVDITITKITSEDFPICLEFKLTDRHGYCHVFEEKAPVLLSENEPIPESFPKTIKLRCELIETCEDYVVISTSEPYGIDSIEGEICFEVSSKYIHGVE